MCLCVDYTGELLYIWIYGLLYFHSCFLLSVFPNQPYVLQVWPHLICVLYTCVYVFPFFFLLLLYKFMHSVYHSAVNYNKHYDQFTHNSNNSSCSVASFTLTLTHTAPWWEKINRTSVWHEQPTIIEAIPDQWGGGGLVFGAGTVEFVPPQTDKQIQRKPTHYRLIKAW